MAKFERYHQAVAFLEGFFNLPLENEFLLKHSANDPGVFVKRMEDLLKRLGNPEKDFKVIHVTGTAGKGSVSLGIQQNLVRAGMKTGLFTSPFVTTQLEKIQVNDLYISPNNFADIVEELKPVIDEMHLQGKYGRPSYFELCLGIALVYFKQQKCQWVVLEVGCGGRHDATNVVLQPKATVITNIDYDHTQLLGKTLTKIARDKAGIIKKGSLFFTTEKRPKLQKMFKDICQKVGARFHVVKAGDSYQERNQTLVKSVIAGLGFRFNPKALEVKLPARFEVMSQKPLVIIDGAHSPVKMAATAHNLKQLKYGRCHLVIGMAANKDGADILAEIVPLADHIYFTRFQIKERRAADPKTLKIQAAKYQKRGVKSQMFLDPRRALMAARKNAKSNDLILVTGSFFLAGDLRREWISEEVILKNRRSFL